MNNNKNEMKLCFTSKSSNEMLARNAIASFLAYLDPPVVWLNELKTAVSEIVTNSIIHGYEEDDEKEIRIKSGILGNKVFVEIEDDGKGVKMTDEILNGEIKITSDDKTAGMGFKIVEAFTKNLKVETSKNGGTKVYFEKEFFN